jgi:hypothetical protein
VFGCPEGAEDSLEHYSRCAIIRDFAWRTCKLVYTRDAFFLAGDSHPWQGGTAEALVRMAIVVYAAYTTFNTGEHVGKFTAEEAKRALDQAAHNAVRGHAASQRILDNSWSVPKRRRS